MKSDYYALSGRIKQHLVDIQRVVDRVEKLMEKAKKTGDDGYLDGVALNLHGFYAGIEHIFEDIARTVDKALPSGPVWHQDLILQISADSGNFRPAVIGGETRYCLDEYRGFRHIVRNVYTFNFKTSRLEELASDVRTCYQLVEKDLNSFIDFLLKTAS
jgi:hypothetical protein